MTFYNLSLPLFNNNSQSLFIIKVPTPMSAALHRLNSEHQVLLHSSGNIEQQQIRAICHY